MTEQTEQPEITQIGMEEIHAMIQHAQYSMFDTEDPHANVPFMQVDVSPDALRDLIFNLMPKGPISDDYWNCNACKEALLTMANWVVVNFDGTLDSVLFPALEVPEQFQNEYTRWVAAVNYAITMDSETERPRVVTCGITRPLDGAHLPKAARLDTTRLHFGVFASPRQLESSRTLTKRTVKAFTLADDILNCRGFNATNIAGVIECHGEDVDFKESVYKAINAASLVLWNIEEYAKTKEQKANIINVACGYEDGLQNFPPELLPILDQFEKEPDYDVLVEALQIFSE